MSSGRRAVRRPRRVQVHFWRQGDPAPYIGYTANISLTGMFIVTNSPLSSGSRIRVEVVDRERGFMVEGVVAHARKMAPALARLNQSGMGVRFLAVDELVRELIPAGSRRNRGDSARNRPDGADAGAADSAAPPAAPSADARGSTARGRAAEARPPPAPDRPAVPVATSGGSYTVRFSGVEEFLEVYRRDILQGGSSSRRSTPRGCRRR